MKRKIATRLMACLIGVTLLNGAIPTYATEAKETTESTEETATESEEDNQTEDSADEITTIRSIAFGDSTNEERIYYLFDSKEVFDELKQNIMSELTSEENAETEKSENTEEDADDKVEIVFKEMDLATVTNESTSVEIDKELIKEIKKSVDEKKSSTMSEAEHSDAVTKLGVKIIAADEAAKQAQKDAEAAQKENTTTYNATNTLLGQKAADCKWDANATGRKTSFNLNIDKDTPIKLEIFYTAGSKAPQVTMISPNKETYSNMGNKETEDFTIINRKSNYITGYDDLQYDVIYIYTTSDVYAGKWNIAYSIDDTTTETILVNASCDDGWYENIEEYKTSVKFFILWYMDENYSHYAASDLVEIVRAEAVPIANTLPTAQEDEPEKKDPYKPIIILIIIAILIGSGVSIYCIIKLKEEKAKQKDYKINKANTKLKKRQIRENGQLEKVLAKYEGDYKDDENVNYTEYIKPDKDVETKDIPKRQFVNNPAAVADAEYTDEEPTVNSKPITSAPVNTPVQTAPSYIPMVPVMGIPTQPGAQQGNNGVYFGMPTMVGYPLQTPAEQAMEAVEEIKKGYSHATPSWKSNSEKPNLKDGEPDWKKGEKVKPRNNNYY